MSKKKSEANSSGRSIIVLCASLGLVYTVFFGYQEPIDPLLQARAQNNEVVDQNTIEQGAFEPAPRAEEDKDMQDQERIEIAQVQVAAPDEQAVDLERVAEPEASEGKMFFSVQELFNEPALPNTAPESILVERVPLAETYERKGNLRSIVDYGLQDEVEYVLKTVQNTHYVYLGKKQTVAVPNILKMGGSVVEIEGKNAINQHSLFGDRVMKISTDLYDVTYKKVIFIVFFEQTGDAWFVQVDQDYYDIHANDIRMVFDERYDR